MPHLPHLTLPPELSIDLTIDDVLDDLSWPGPAPGRWEVPADTAHIDALLRSIEARD